MVGVSERDGQIKHATRWPGRAFEVALITTFLGPPIGGLSLAIVVGLSSGPSIGPITQAVANFLMLIAVFTLYSFLAGVVPALLAGIAMAVPVWRTGSISYRSAALAGFASTALFIGLLSVSAQRHTAGIGDAIGGAISFSCLGACASVVCLWLAARFGILPPSSQQTDEIVIDLRSVPPNFPSA